MSGPHVIVVGSGVIGLLTAMALVEDGASVQVVDQHDIPSPHATSYAPQRVVRALHPGNPELTRTAARARDGWRAIERTLGERWVQQVGTLLAMPPAEVGPALELLAAAGVTGHRVSPAHLAAHPVVRFPAECAAVLEPSAGVVAADRFLHRVAGWLAERPSARLHHHHPVLQIGPGARVRLGDGRVLRGDAVVVAAGPWSRSLLPPEVADRTTLYRQSALFYRPPAGRWGDLPAVPSMGTPDGAWMIPPVSGRTAVLSAASACRPVAQRTDTTTAGRWVDHLVRLGRKHLSAFDPSGIVDARDGYYLADRAGDGRLLARLDDGVVLAYAACGGASFKLAPLVARTVADAVTGVTERNRQPVAVGM